MKKKEKENLHYYMQELRKGKKEAYTEIYHQYNTLVYRISVTILKNQEEAEDNTQSVFTKLWQMKPEQLPTEYETSWLYHVTKNEALNYIRKQKNMLTIEEIDHIADDKYNLEDILSKEEYQKIIEKLPKKEKEIVSLKILGQFSFREIAQILQIPMGTVQWKYYKAVHSLKLLLTNLCAFLISLSLLVLERKKHTKKGNIMQEKEESQESQDDVEQDKTQDNKEQVIKNEVITDEETSTNEIVENVVVDFPQQQQEKNNKIEIGLFSIMTVFLITTILFFTNYKKYQQKSYHKVSKE